MKKAVSILLLISCFMSYTNCMTYAAAGKRNTVIKTGIKKDVKQEVPERKKYTPLVIEDEIADEVKEQSKNRKRTAQQPSVIEDEAVYTITKEEAVKKKKQKNYKKELIADEKVVLTEENKKFKRPLYTGKIKTENGLEVVLKPVSKIKTGSTSIKLKNKENTDNYKLALPEIGDQVAFRVVKNVEKDGKIIIPKNTIVYAQVGEVAPRAMGGAPAEITIENFKMMDKKGNLIPLDGKISSSGYSLSFWIGLAELATTPFLIGFAVPVLRLLPGGQAVITPRKNYVIYY